MSAWMQETLGFLRAGNPAVVVHVAEIRGSAPREAGACMVVTADDFAGTIGGGQLEYDAQRHARKILAGENGEAIVNWSLGPELGQCCGGAVTLSFEAFAPADLAWLDRMAELVNRPMASFRVVELGSTGPEYRSFANIQNVEDTFPDWAQSVIALMTRDTTCRFVASRDADDQSIRVVERIDRTGQPLWLFGAGHVGRAVMRALEPLPFDITWVDGREDMFPEDTPDGVRTFASAMPELLIDQAPPGTFYLVMTHSHPLDEEICHAVLERGDAGYLGLIGSRTKHVRFLSRLRGRGHAGDALETLTCPVGLPQITGKSPAVVAASIVADLLTRLSVAEVLERHHADEEKE